MQDHVNTTDSIRHIEDLEIILKNIASENWMLVCDAAFHFLPEHIKAVFEKYAARCVPFSDFTPNPSFESVMLGLSKFRDEKCSMIVAVGGGSAIDVAKCIKLFYGVSDPLKYLSEKTEVDYKTIGDIPLIAMPTTAGTGSEATRHAVIYYNDQKQSIGDSAIIPDIAVLEPSVLRSLPLYQKKSTMLDALCQGIESWWSVNSTSESKEYSRAAVETIRDNWQEYLFSNSDAAANKILYAANFAGKAINITATTAAHAMSYKLSSIFRFPHGHAVAVCMPQVWQYLLTHTDRCIDRRGQAYLETVLKEIPVSVDWFVSLMKQLDMGNPCAKAPAKAVEILTDSVNPVRMKNFPVSVDKNEIKSMYERIIEHES